MLRLNQLLHIVPKID